MNLSKTDLLLLFDACEWATVYLRKDMLPRLEERDLDALLDLGCDLGEEGEEEAEFLDALETVDSDIRELDRLADRLFDEAQEL